MKEKYVTNRLFLEFKEECIELIFTGFLSYSQYFGFTRTSFKSIFKYMYQQYDSNCLFILRSATKPITGTVHGITISDFKSFLSDTNRVIYADAKKLRTRACEDIPRQLDFIEYLYIIDKRFQQISARQYSSSLNSGYRKQQNQQYSLADLDDVWKFFKGELDRRWSIVNSSTSLEDIDLENACLSSDTPTLTTSTPGLNEVTLLSSGWTPSLPINEALIPISLDDSQILGSIMTNCDAQK